MQSVGECSEMIQEGSKLTCFAGMSRGAATVELRQDQGPTGSQMGQQQHAAMMAQHHAAHAHAVQQMMQQQQQQQQHIQQQQQHIHHHQQQQQHMHHQQQQQESHAPQGPQQQQQPTPINLGGILQQVGSMANQFLGPMLQQQLRPHPPPHLASSPDSSGGSHQMQQLLQLQENVLREQQQLQQQQQLLQQQFSTILPLVTSSSPSAALHSSPSLPPPPPPTNSLHACLMATWRSLYILPPPFLSSVHLHFPNPPHARFFLLLHFRSSVERDEFVSHGKVTSMAMGILAQYVTSLLQYNNVTL
jgi:hypothetical protein